jgi:hypothetical protein
MSAAPDALTAALGKAVLNLWSDLPRDIQERVFEAAAAALERGDHVREDLAQLLHDVHDRTKSPH